MKVTIEVVGLCGAGKTTFIKLLEKKIIKKNKKIIFQNPKKNNLFLYYFYILKILSKSLYYQFFYVIFFLTIKSNWWLIKKIAYREAGLLKKEGAISILKDTGIMQPFISFEIEHKASNAKVPLDTLLKVISKPDIIIFFNIKKETAIKRYHERYLKGYGKPLRKNSEYYFDQADRIKTMMIEYCKHHNIRIVNVNSENEFNDEYIDTVIEQIQNEINKYLL